METTRRKANTIQNKMKIYEEEKEIGTNIKQIRSILKEANHVNDMEQYGKNKMRWREVMNTKLGVQNAGLQYRLSSQTELNERYH